MKNPHFLFLFLFFFTACKEHTTQQVIPNKATTVLYEVCAKNKNSLKEVNSDILASIPKKELIFLKDEVHLASKMQSFYDVNLASGGKYFLSDYFKIDNVEAFVLFSDFGISPTFPCRQKLFLFLNGKFQKAINLSAWLGDSSELLSYKSRVHVDPKNKTMQIERFQSYFYEDIFSEQVTVTEKHVEILEINCSNLQIENIKKHSSSWNNDGFHCE